MTRARVLAARLADRRGGEVIFLSHCLLNENTRYLGGACRAACVREVVERCLGRDLGIVQMSCPEQHAWGGVLKPLMLMGYGIEGTPRGRLRPLLLPLFVLWTRLVYRRLADRVAAQVRDYRASGFRVVAVVGIDGSPSCGIATTLDLANMSAAVARTDLASISVAQMDALVRQGIRGGPGLFTVALRRALRRRNLDVPFLAHDLIGELDEKQSALALPAQTPPAHGARSNRRE